MWDADSDSLEDSDNEIFIRNKASVNSRSADSDSIVNGEGVMKERPKTP